jgi:hypothetical protein
LIFIFDGNGATSGTVPEPELWMDPDGWTEIPNNTNNLTRIGHTFKGWAGNKNAINPDFGTPNSTYTIGIIPGAFLIRDILSIIEDENDNALILYAVWEAIPPVTLTYNSNGATNGTAPIDTNSPYQNGTTITILGQETLTKTNNIFLGWATTNNATLSQYTKDTKLIITTNTTLYAIWGPPTTPLYTITYNNNNATSGTAPIDTNNYSQGVLAPIKANTGELAKIGHKFLGWHTNPAATTPVFTATNTTVTPTSFNIQTSNITFFAIWKPIQYHTITYIGNGDTGEDPVDSNNPYENGSTVTVLNKGSLARLHGHFMGWTDLSIPNVTHPIESEFTITENTTLYAVWETIPPINPAYQVLYNKNGHNTEISGTAPVDYNLYLSGSSVTVLGQGTLVRPGYTFLGWATNPSATIPNRMPGSTFTIPPNMVILYAVWSYTGFTGGGNNTTNTSSMITVPYDGCYAGTVGSKGSTLKYTGSAGGVAVLKVASNLSDLSRGAVIENLIIDGDDKSNVTGVLLENVCNCLIRNLTIKNCTVGIKVVLTNSSSTNCGYGNRFEHIRLINVKNGIVFEGVSIAKDFSHTTLDDVGISLKKQVDTSDVGIKVGDNANLYCSFIKANVWLSQSKGVGLKVVGQIKGCLVNLAVEQDTTGGVGIHIQSGATVYDNQHFLLTSQTILSPNDKKINNNNPPIDDITINP